MDLSDPYWPTCTGYAFEMIYGGPLGMSVAVGPGQASCRQDCICLEPHQNNGTHGSAAFRRGYCVPSHDHLAMHGSWFAAAIPDGRWAQTS